MKTLMHTLGNIFLTVLVMLLIVYGWAFVEIKLLLKSQPELFGYAFYMQKTDDMTPEFNANDVIVIKKGSDFSVGDMILYFDSNDSTYKVHYVVSTDSNFTVTKCSTCDTNNEAISKDNIVGRAIGKVAFMGSVIKFFKNKIVLTCIAVLGIFFLVVSQYMEYKPKKKTTK